MKKSPLSFLLSLFCSTFCSIICLNAPSSHFVFHLRLTPCLFSVIHPPLPLSLSLYHAQRSAILLAGSQPELLIGFAAHAGWGERREEKEIEIARMSSKASDAWKTEGGVFKSEVFHSIPLHQKGPPWMPPVQRRNRVACIMPRWFIIPKCLQV